MSDVFIRSFEQKFKTSNKTHRQRQLHTYVADKDNLSGNNISVILRLYYLDFRLPLISSGPETEPLNRILINELVSDLNFTRVHVNVLWVQSVVSIKRKT